MSSNDWGVTRRLLAEVLLTDDVRVEGELHLLARTSYPPGPETPLEMLNRPERFFALTRPDQQDVSLISKAQVVMVSYREDVAPLEPDRASAAIAAELTVALSGGMEYRGRATFELPPSGARVLDYINEPGKFFSLSDGDRLRCINKAFVRLVHPLD